MKLAVSNIIKISAANKVRYVLFLLNLFLQFFFGFFSWVVVVDNFLDTTCRFFYLNSIHPTEILVRFLIILPNYKGLISLKVSVDH